MEVEPDIDEVALNVQLVEGVDPLTALEASRRDEPSPISGCALVWAVIVALILVTYFIA